MSSELKVLPRFCPACPAALRGPSVALPTAETVTKRPMRARAGRWPGRLGGGGHVLTKKFVKISLWHGDALS